MPNRSRVDVPGAPGSAGGHTGGDPMEQIEGNFKGVRNANIYHQSWLTEGNVSAALLIPQREGHLTNAAVREVLGLTKISAVRPLRELVAGQWLSGTGKRGRGARYTPGPRLLNQTQSSNKSAETDTIRNGTDTIDP
jgi:hypothetical protein